jgi:hypothetical protein
MTAHEVGRMLAVRLALVEPQAGVRDPVDR